MTVTMTMMVAIARGDDGDDDDGDGLRSYLLICRRSYINDITEEVHACFSSNSSHSNPFTYLQIRSERPGSTPSGISPTAIG